MTSGRDDDPSGQQGRSQYLGFQRSLHAPSTSRSYTESNDSPRHVPDSDRHVVKKRELNLERFRNHESASSSRSQTVTISDSNDSLSSLSDIASPPKKKKKRKFVLAEHSSKHHVRSSPDYESAKPAQPAANTSSTTKEEPFLDLPNMPTLEEQRVIRSSKDFAGRLKRICDLFNDCRTDDIDKVLVNAHGSPLKAVELIREKRRLLQSRAKLGAINVNGKVPPQQSTNTKSTSYMFSSPSSTTHTQSLISSKHNVQPPAVSMHGPGMPSNSISKTHLAKSHSNSLQRRNGEILKPSSARASEDNEVLSVSDSSADGSDDEDYDKDSSNEKRASEWFNKCTVQQLHETVPEIDKEQARLIVDMRPFQSPEDIRKKFSKTKGLKIALFENHVELLASLRQVDAILDKCEKVGVKLKADRAQWADKARRKQVEYLESQPEGAANGYHLRDFQLRGVNWLNSLYRNKCSGILADDMGLGKTAQIISILNYITLEKNQRPHLIVVPSSVLTNWFREFNLFGPHLRVEKFHGSQQERLAQKLKLKKYPQHFDVLITTYDIASGMENDHKFLRRVGFDAAIFDEAHVLKNQNTIKFSKLNAIRSNWRILMTGTPLQNNLFELISLLKFMMPTYFIDADDALARIFKVDRKSQSDQYRINRAKAMMEPFVLRRRKVDVLDNLKSKTEKVKFCDMLPDQLDLYKQAFARTKAAIMAQASGESTSSTTRRSQGNALMELRKAANHPLLFRRLYTAEKINALARSFLTVPGHEFDKLSEVKEDFAINSDAELCMLVAMQYKQCAKHVIDDKEWLKSGKIIAMKEVIDQARARDERLVIFSQFKQTLDIICMALETFGVSYRGFTGSTDVNSRQDIVDEFSNDPSISCFLLTTRAGGVGINLTAANWVILFDQDFNPQNDRQAADRCYRMGQDKEVTIVRLLSRGTIDEHIFELGEGKVKLAESVERQVGSESIVIANDENAGDEDNEEEKNDKAIQEDAEKGLLRSIFAVDSL